MNLDIFYDKKYYVKLSQLMLINEFNPVFPFEDFDIPPDNLINADDDFTAVYNFLNDVKFIYYCDQMWVGHTSIDGITYIIKIDDEVNISIIGDNEVNWTEVVLSPDDYLDFKSFCSKNYNTSYDDSDYDRLLEIQIKNITF